jgi:hypothetical protein
MKITKKAKGLLIVGVLAIALAGITYQAMAMDIDPPGGIVIPFTLTK